MDSTPSPASLAQAPSAPETELPRSFEANGSSHPAETRIPGIHDLCALADCTSVGLTQPEFAQILLSVAGRCHYNQPPTAVPTAAQREAFFRSLHLAELALAHACALGREPAWRLFLARYREPLAQAAVAITGSVSLGRDLADALPAELFGLSTRDGDPDARRSPLLSYTGRGSLLGWLRSTLAQRHIDRHRRTHREAPLNDLEPPAAEPIATPAPETLTRLQQALTTVLRSLDPEDAFILSAWFLEGRTLLQIARLLRVSEATVSRKVKRLTANLRALLCTRLQAGGLSRRAAEEALGTDPRDLTLNLRALLQSRASSAFHQQTPSQASAAE